LELLGVFGVNSLAFTGKGGSFDLEGGKKNVAKPSGRKKGGRGAPCRGFKQEKGTEKVFKGRGGKVNRSGGQQRKKGDPNPVRWG